MFIKCSLLKAKLLIYTKLVESLN